MTEVRLLPVMTNARFSIFAGYRFVDFDSPAAAQKAVASLKANGVQAQMAKVSLLRQRGSVHMWTLVCVSVWEHMLVLHSEQTPNYGLHSFCTKLLGKRNHTRDLAYCNLSDLAYSYS